MWNLQKGGSVILREIDWPQYKFDANGHQFTVFAGYDSDGRVIFTPENGWQQLEQQLQQPWETLLEAIDDCIYNADPERYVIENV